MKEPDNARSQMAYAAMISTNDMKATLSQSTIFVAFTSRLECFLPESNLH